VSIQRLGHIEPNYLWVNGLKVLFALAGRVDHVSEWPIGGVSIKMTTEEKERQTHPSNCNAITYPMYTYKDIRRPTGLSYHSEVPTKDITLPTYIGSVRTLKGNPSTRWSMRMPK